jgi:uncharacterized OB-fold protein
MSVFSFKQGLKDSKLLGCICEECENKMLPPRMICSKCGSTKLKEHCFDGKGTIKTKTVIHVPLTKFQDIGLYTVGIIELDEGPMITGMVLGEVDKVKIGDRVEAAYIDMGEERVLAFKKID